MFLHTFVFIYTLLAHYINNLFRMRFPLHFCGLCVCECIYWCCWMLFFCFDVVLLRFACVSVTMNDVLVFADVVTCFDFCLVRVFLGSFLIFNNCSKSKKKKCWKMKPWIWKKLTLKIINQNPFFAEMKNKHLICQT